MRYPIRVVKRLEVEFDKSTNTPTGRREEYWCVNAGFVGTCGHKHPDEESAGECLGPMEQKYRETRWPKRKKKDTGL